MLSLLALGLDLFAGLFVVVIKGVGGSSVRGLGILGCF